MLLFLQVSSEALADLLRARDDLLIWEEGLEPVYFKFLQPYSTPHIATLLSILWYNTYINFYNYFRNQVKIKRQTNSFFFKEKSSEQKTTLKDNIDNYFLFCFKTFQNDYFRFKREKIFFLHIFVLKQTTIFSSIFRFETKKLFFSFSF